MPGGIHICSHPAEMTNEPICCVSWHWHNQVRRKSYQILYIYQAFTILVSQSIAYSAQKIKIMRTNQSTWFILSSGIPFNPYSCSAFHSSPPHPLHGTVVPYPQGTNFILPCQTTPHSVPLKGNKWKLYLQQVPPHFPTAPSLKQILRHIARKCCPGPA